MANSKRRCKQCGEYFPQELEGSKKTNRGWFHNYDCLELFAQKVLKKIIEKNKKEEKKAWGKRKEKMQGVSHQNKLTQKAFNQYIRLRDKSSNRPCISCGNSIDYVTKVRGGTHDAGHYKTVKAHPELRFNTRNVNVECKHCNNFDSEHLVGMRKGISERYGQDVLDWLDGHHELKKYTIEQHKKFRELLNKRAKRYL